MDHSSKIYRCGCAVTVICTEQSNSIDLHYGQNENKTDYKYIMCEQCNQGGCPATSRCHQQRGPDYRQQTTQEREGEGEAHSLDAHEIAPLYLSIS